MKKSSSDLSQGQHQFFQDFNSLGSYSNPQIYKSNQQFSKNNKKQQNITFKFLQSTETFTKFLLCPLCEKLMIKPMRLHPCGHTFCYNCVSFLIEVSNNIFLSKQVNQNQKLKQQSISLAIKQLSENKKKKGRKSNKNSVKFCPYSECNKQYTHIQQDRTAQGLIDQLKVMCTNEGCVWKGKYDQYKKIHKQKCPLKNGLGEWLKNMKKVVAKKQRLSILDPLNKYKQEKKQQQKEESKEKDQDQHSDQNSSSEQNNQVQQIFKNIKKDDKDKDNDEDNNENQKNKYNQTKQNYIKQYNQNNKNGGNQNKNQQNSNHNNNQDQKYHKNNKINKQTKNLKEKKENRFQKQQKLINQINNRIQKNNIFQKFKPNFKKQENNSYKKTYQLNFYFNCTQDIEEQERKLDVEIQNTNNISCSQLNTHPKSFKSFNLMKGQNSQQILTKRSRIYSDQNQPMYYGISLNLQNQNKSSYQNLFSIKLKNKQQNQINNYSSIMETSESKYLSKKIKQFKQ